MDADSKVVDPNFILQTGLERPRPKRALEEQRRCIRAAVDLDACLEISGHAFAVHLRDISKSGLLIESAQSVAEGTTVGIVFDAIASSLDSAKRSTHISLHGRVVRLVHLESQLFLMGIQVVEDPVAQSALQSIVLRLSLQAAKKRNALKRRPWM